MLNPDILLYIEAMRGTRTVATRTLTETGLANLLSMAEKAHAASGDPADQWPIWYARFITSKLAEEKIVPCWQ